MADPQALIYADRPGGLPASQAIAPGFEIELESVSAAFDGTGAAGSFYPCLAVYSQDDKLIGRWFPPAALSAGDTAEVSFGPFLGRGVSAGGGGGGSTLDYTEITADVTINALSAATADVIVTAAAVTVDGATRIRVEFYCYTLSTTSFTPPALDRGTFLELYEDGADIGRIGYLDGANIQYISAPISVSRVLTPVAGTHVYSIRGWQQHAFSAPGVVFAGGGGPDTALAAFILITEV